MSARVLVINGHPDPSPERLCAALAAAYEEGACAAHREVRRIDVGSLDFPLIRDAASFTDGNPPAVIRQAQDAIRWADHIVLIYPLWLGGAPALLKGFFEQVFRYGYALLPGSGSMRGMLLGRSARIVVTMGMPSLVYRLVFGAFGVRALERGVLQLSGISPVNHTFLGSVEAVSPGRRGRWFKRMHALGRLGL